VGSVALRAVGMWASIQRYAIDVPRLGGSGHDPVVAASRSGQRPPVLTAAKNHYGRLGDWRYEAMLCPITHKIGQ
jgi:hypothetical protein